MHMRLNPDENTIAIMARQKIALAHLTRFLDESKIRKLWILYDQFLLLNIQNDKFVIILLYCWYRIFFSLEMSQIPIDLYGEWSLQIANLLAQIIPFLCIPDRNQTMSEYTSCSLRKRNEIYNHFSTLCWRDSRSVNLIREKCENRLANKIISFSSRGHWSSHSAILSLSSDAYFIVKYDDQCWQTT